MWLRSHRRTAAYRCTRTSRHVRDIDEGVGGGASQPEAFEPVRDAFAGPIVLVIQVHDAPCGVEYHPARLRLIPMTFRIIRTTARLYFKAPEDARIAPSRGVSSVIEAESSEHGTHSAGGIA